MRRHPDSDFVHVDDLVQANLLAAIADATADATGEAFNIGTGTTITIANLTETISDVTDADSEIVHVDPLEGDIDHSQADITRARDTLGYEPQYSIEAGLRAFLG